MKLISGWVTTNKEFECAKCKYFPGDGEICEKCGLVVYGGYKCFNSGWKIRVVEIKIGVEIEVGLAELCEVTVVGDKVVMIQADPVFSFERKGVDE